MKKFLALVVFFVASIASVQAQQVNNYWLCSPGNISPWCPVSAANPMPVTATITPSGTQNVNLTQILGAAPSLTNPLWVFPATGATFPISATSLPLPTGGATAANQTTIITALGSPMQQTGGTVGSTSQYPSGATAITASATGTTGATTATLAGTSGKTTYLCTMSIRANATAAATGNATVTGTITGTLNFTQWTAPLASGLGINEQTFVPCVPASATNTGIAVISAAPGTNGVVSVTATGYQL